MHDKRKIRIDEQKKQYVYYSGNSYEIKRYLTTALELSYRQSDINDMQLQWVNLTKKIINQMAVVYRDPAMRHIAFIEKKIKTEKSKDGDGNEVVKEVNVNEAKEKELTEEYNELLPSDINIQDKRAHRLGALHNTIFTQVMLNEKTGKIKYKTRSSWLIDAVFDSNGDVIEFSYKKYYIGKSGEPEEFRIYWTDDKLFMRDTNGNKMNLPVRGSDDARKPRKTDKNPYGIIPFAKFVIEDCEEWGEGKSDIVNVNEQVNLLLTKLVSRDLIRGEGVMVATNLDLDKKGKREDEVTEVKASVSHPITVEGVREDMVQPRLEYVSTNPQIQAVRDSIDWYIMFIAGLNGLRGADIISEIKDTSDYQKIMDAVDQMELRRDDIEPLRNYEKERFIITKAVNNSYVGTAIGNEFKLKTIKDDVKLRVDFADVVVHKTPADLIIQRDWELTHGLSTEVEWMMEDNPDLTELEAREEIQKNKKENRENELKFNKPVSRLEQIAREGVISTTQPDLPG